MKDTREQILCTARNLFNQNGYNSVSMGDIAGAVGISKGNLTYHFKKKEDLIEAIILDWKKSYAPPAIPQNLEDLNALFVRSQRNTEQNAYYFWHYTQLSQLSPRIRQHQAQVGRQMHQVYAKGFDKLRKDGYFKEEVFPGHYNNIIRTLRILCVYWLPQSRLEQEPQKSGDFFACVWSVLYPLLTEKGLKIYTEKIKTAPESSNT